MRRLRREQGYRVVLSATSLLDAPQVRGSNRVARNMNGNRSASSNRRDRNTALPQLVPAYAR